MTPGSKGRPRSSGVLAVLAMGSALVLCCAAPVLFAAGAASVLGAALRNGWLILVTAGLVAVAATSAVRRGRRLGGCSTPGRLPHSHRNLGILPTKGACGSSEPCDRLEQPGEHHE